MKHEQLASQLLENILKRRINQVYREQLKHEPREIKVYYFENTIIVIIDGIVTKTEKILNQNSQQFLSSQVRNFLNHLVESHLKNVIEEVMKVTVVDLLFKAKVDTDRLGTIAIFEIQPSSFV